MIIAVDFDGTIVEHQYPEIGKPKPFAFATLKKLQEDQHQLILWTARTGELLQEAVDFCEKNGITFYAVNAAYPEEEAVVANVREKIHADVFIDDHNLGGLPDWGVIYHMIHSGHPLQPYKAEEMAIPKKPWWKRK